MNNNHSNQPADGPAMTAEEFVASLEGGACQQEEEACGCAAAPACPPEPERGCASQVVCCQVFPAPKPPAPEVDEGCCCKRSFRAALQPLCDQEISGYLDFTRTAFVTGGFVAGATIVPLTGTEAATYDNLADDLTGTFRRFSPCSSDLLDISALLYYPQEGRTTALPFTASQVSLCELAALVIQQAAVSAEGELTAEEVAARNFRRIKRQLASALGPCGGPCGKTDCCCDGQECCCAQGVLTALTGSNLSRRVTLTAEWLALYNAELLGSVGNVLVLANDLDQRLYFICAAKVQFLA